MTMPEPSLEWQNLALWRGDRCLQKQLAGELRAGKAITLRGSNGCGKTTLLRTLCGLSEPEVGDIHWSGQDIRSCRAEFHQALAYAGHQTGLKGELSARENLLFGLRLEKSSAPIDVQALLDGLGLTNCADLPSRNLSAGQKRRAALARVLGSGKSLWVLDEPFSNLDQSGRDWLAEQFNSHLNTGGMLLMAAHQDTGISATAETIIDLAEAGR